MSAGRFNKKRNKTQLSFVQGYRKDGKVKHKVIKNLGYLEDYLNEYEDPVAHFQQIAKVGGCKTTESRRFSYWYILTSPLYYFTFQGWI